MKLIQSPDRLMQQLQTNVQEILDPISQNPITQGVILKNISLQTGVTNIVPTTLGRILIGWEIIGKNANSNIWDSQTTNMTPNQTLQLLCSANCIVNIYVF